MQASFSFTTDTAALSIFDLQAIRHPTGGRLKRMS